MKKKKEIKTLKKRDPTSEWFLGNLLGKGSFGEVYMAKSTSGEVCAAKVCVIKSDADYADMKLEVEILTICQHPNILKARASYFYDKKIWMLLELCQGGALDDIIERLEGLEEDTIKVIMYQTLQGLDYLHKNCIIHRDIKAGNLMLTDAGVLKLADFGVSAMMPTPSDYRNTFIGTPYWMAPEAILTESFPNQKYNSKIDIWSVGITVLECAEVIPPDSEYSPVQVLLVRTKSPPPTLREPDRWSESMNHFVEQTLTRDPNKRPSAEKCLTLSWFQGEDLQRSDKLLELYKLSKAMDEASEEIIEDLNGDQIDITLDEEHDSDTSSHPESNFKDVSRNSYHKHEDSPVHGAKSPVSRSDSKQKVTKTIKKTVNIEINGVTRTKTFIRVIDENQKNARERDKSLREKVENQLKILKLEEQREQKKLVSSQNSYLVELLSKHKYEMDNIMDKYRNECDTSMKLVQKEMDKRKNVVKVEFEKYFKRVKSANEKEKKRNLKALSSKSRNKYSLQYMDPNFVPKLQERCYQEIHSVFKKEEDELASAFVTLLKQRNDQLISTLNNISITKLNQVLEAAQIQRSHICVLLEYIIQRKIKTDAKELALTTRYMTEKRNELQDSQNRVLKEFPKIQRSENKKIMDEYKKALRRMKMKNDKDLLQKRYDELSAEANEKLRILKEAQAEKLEKFEKNFDLQIKELQEYHDAKNQAIHRMYQEMLYKRYIEDEKAFKDVLMQLHDLRKTRDGDFIKEVNLTSTFKFGPLAALKAEQF